MRLRSGPGPATSGISMVTPASGRRAGVRLRTEVRMLKHIKAAVVPVVLVAAIAGAAGYRAQDSGSGKRLDELSQERPAAASTHFPVDGALVAASKAADEKRWTEAFQAHQAELFFQAAAAAEAEQAAQAAAAANTKKKPAAPTGRGGSSGGGSSRRGGRRGGAPPAGAALRRGGRGA